MPAHDPTLLCVAEVPGSEGRVNPEGCGTDFQDDFGGVLGSDGCTVTAYEVFGVVPDGVIRVGLFLNHRFHRVRVLNNLFWYRMQVSGEEDEHVDAEVLRYGDGSILVTALGVGWKPSQAAEDRT